MTVSIDELKRLAEVCSQQASCERMNAAAAAVVGGVCEVETNNVRLADARALARAADVLREMASAASRSHLTLVRSSDLRACR